MKVLLPYLKKFRKQIIAGPIFKLIEAIFELIVPLIMANIIDVGIKNRDSDYVINMGIVIIILGITGFCCTLVCQYLAAKASQGVGTELRAAMFKHVGELSQSDTDKFGASSLVTRITNDTYQVQLGVAMFIRLAVRAPFLVIGATISAIGINLHLSIIFIISAIVIAGVLYYLMSRSVPYYRAIQKLIDKVALLVRENLSGARVIRAFSRQKNEEQQFEQAGEDVLKTSIRVGKLSALLNPITFLIVNIGIILVIWFGGYKVYDGILEQGEIVALVNYMNQIMLALIVVANIVIIFTRALASGTRISEVLNAQPTMIEGAGTDIKESHPIILEFEDVYFAYGDSNGYALKNISFKIEKNTTLGIIGGTGSGKSTIVALIMRFYDPTKGIIKLDGENLADYKYSQIHSKIGLVPQKSQLFYGTLRENMQWADKNASDEEIYRALKTAQALDFVEKWDDGLNHMIMRGGKNLSGGQRQRLTIARALIGSPQMLILDDSASALDFATDAALRKAIAEYGKGISVILISQRASTLKNADNIIVMDEGEIVGAGTHEQLFKTNEIYTEICLSQMEGGEQK